MTTLTKSSSRGKTRSTKRSGPSKVSGAVGKLTETKVQGVGAYAKNAKSTYSKAFTGKAVKGLTRTQAYKLEKAALNNEKLKINAKPEMIKSVGLALASNTASPAAGLTTVGVTDALTKNKDFSVSSGINNLISGGAQETDSNNAEESIADQYVIK